MSLHRCITPDSISDAREACAAWNAAHPIGTRVRVHPYRAAAIETVTVRAAVVLGEDTAVVDLQGFGQYYLDRVKPL